MITILVVEDEKYALDSLLKQIREYDKQESFRVLQASNGKEAYQLYIQYSPELVITDIRMPGMDGLELLKAIREKDENIQVVILSAYSDFEYAREALTYGASDYLLKPIKAENLGSCLDKFLKRKVTEKKEALMTGRDMVTQYIADCIRREDFSNFVEERMFKKIFRDYQISVIYFAGECRPDKGRFLTEIEKLYGGEFWMEFRFLETENDLWTLVVNLCHENSFFHRRILRLLQEEGYDVYIGVSALHTDAKEVHQAYDEALKTCKYKVYGKERLLLSAQPAEEGEYKYYLPKKEEDLLKEALKCRNTRKTEMVIENVFADIKKTGSISMECLELLLSQFLVIYRQTLGEGGVNKEGMTKGRTSVLQFDSIEDMRDFLIRIGRNICTMLDAPENGKHKDIVETMAEYAQQHFDQEVTVKELAEKVLFMNQDYLSHLFVEKKGISYSCYLRQIRMQNAGKLLENRKLSITEVASMSGYNDTSQFIRVFKKDYGMTPKKYRDSMKWENSPGEQQSTTECEGGGCA